MPDSRKNIILSPVPARDMPAACARRILLNPEDTQRRHKRSSLIFLERDLAQCSRSRLLDKILNLDSEYPEATSPPESRYEN